ncbi:MAG: hypothetical protein ACRD5F_13150, partial [Candidatus Acidiferrales bacterium]
LHAHPRPFTQTETNLLEMAHETICAWSFCVCKHSASCTSRMYCGQLSAAGIVAGRNWIDRNCQLAARGYSHSHRNDCSD